MRRIPGARGVGLAAVLVGAWAAASCSLVPPVRHHRVDIRDLTFQPSDRQVALGDTISWVNHDIVPHTVTDTDGRWDSGVVPPGGRFTRVADVTGATRYYCRYHPTMTGNLSPRASVSTAARGSLPAMVAGRGERDRHGRIHTLDHIRRMR